MFVRPPVHGSWVALNTPAERIPSHGTDRFGQRYAYDLVQYNPTLQSFSTRPVWQQFVYVVRAKAFLCWGQPVFACFDGKVVAAADEWPDRLRVNSTWQLLRAHLLARAPHGDEFRPLLGNHVIIEGDAGFALYAHLRRGSIAIAVGQRVRCGQPVGAVGNSGNSTQPHLHFQLMDKPSPREASSIYCGFLDCDGEVPCGGPSHALVPQLMTPFHAKVASRDPRFADGGCRPVAAYQPTGENR